MSTPPARRSSTNGAWPATGRSAANMRCAEQQAAAASSIASTPATCIWCSGRAADGKPVRFRVTIDGAAPGRQTTAATSMPRATASSPAQRLYQLIRQPGAIADHTFEIEFLDPGVQAFAFTFG